MKVKLLDYRGAETVFDVGNIEDIAVMNIRVLTGDEVLTVIYKDYTVEVFESSYSRIADYYDDKYDIYNITNGTNMLDDENFINRTDTYWR